MDASAFDVIYYDYSPDTADSLIDRPKKGYRGSDFCRAEIIIYNINDSYSNNNNSSAVAVIHATTTTTNDETMNKRTIFFFFYDIRY